MKAKLSNFFKLSEYQTSFKTELLAGLTTFMTIAYILILNPIILSDPFRIMEQNDLAAQISNGVFIGTCIGAFIGTLLCAIYAKVPLAQAPGMGLNAFFAYTVVLSMGYTYQQALVIVFISGILFILMTAIGFREAIIKSIPNAIKLGMTPGIGLFIMIIGLKNSGLVVAHQATLISLVDFSQWIKDPSTLTQILSPVIAFIGLIVMTILFEKKVKGSILLGILTTTILGIPLGITKLQNIEFNIGHQWIDFMEVSFLKMDFLGLLNKDSLFQSISTILLLVISFSLVNMFDSIGTLFGAAKQSGLMNEKGEMLQMKEALMSDAISTTTGALLGTSTVTTVVESSAGIAAGGKTGLTSLTTAFLFLTSLIFAPIIGIVPSIATAPALIFVGTLMLTNVKEVDFSNLEEALPAICTMVFMPFTYSIANGIAFGLITYTLIKILTFKWKEINVLTLIISLIFIARYALISLG